jgi:hypothetical protein
MLFSGMGTEDDKDLALLVVLEGDAIVVTMPGTSYSVSYRKLRNSPWLVASDIHEDPDSPISKFHFEPEPGPERMTRPESSAG